VNTWKSYESECTEGAVIRCGCKVCTKEKEYVFFCHISCAVRILTGAPSILIFVLFLISSVNIETASDHILANSLCTSSHSTPCGSELCSQTFLCSRHSFPYRETSQLYDRFEGGNTRVESETRAVAEDDSFANTLQTAYYVCVNELFFFKEVCL
jgi:hypothetical protein